MIAAILFAAHVAGSPVDYAHAKALADANEASLGAAEHAKYHAEQDRLLRAAITRCAGPNPDLSPFTVVLSLNADGSVAGSWLKGGTELASCVWLQLLRSGMPGHWKTPFYSSFEVSFQQH